MLCPGSSNTALDTPYHLVLHFCVVTERTPGATLKRYRVRADLSQRELGELAGLAAPQQTITRYELGPSIPSARNAEKLAAVTQMWDTKEATTWLRACDRARRSGTRPSIQTPESPAAVVEADVEDDDFLDAVVDYDDTVASLIGAIPPVLQLLQEQRAERGAFLAEVRADQAQILNRLDLLATEVRLLRQTCAGPPPPAPREPQRRTSPPGRPPKPAR